MKLINYFSWFLLLSLLTGCAFITTTPKTKNETMFYTAALIKSTALRTLDLYEKGVINADEKEHIKSLLNDSNTALNLAQSLTLTDVESSNEYLDLSINVLENVIEILGVYDEQ